MGTLLFWDLGLQLHDEIRDSGHLFSMKIGACERSDGVG